MHRVTNPATSVPQVVAQRVACIHAVFCQSVDLYNLIWKIRCMKNQSARVPQPFLFFFQESIPAADLSAITSSHTHRRRIHNSTKQSSQPPLCPLHSVSTTAEYPFLSFSSWPPCNPPSLPRSAQTSAMQADMQTHMDVDQPEEDQDSLFGSPPPSPIRGRSPSPALALPSASFLQNGLSSSTQNVGTIALPGSHLYSELPVNPLALSLSHTPCELAPRPPALSQHLQGINPNLTQFHTPSTSASSTPTWSRASSAAPPANPKKKSTKLSKSKSKSKESTPRPAPPDIPLPDPSNPPPANFLRNQSGLLGTAGLVGGIKPSNLSVHRHTRGTTSTNPIVVEDEDDPPLLGRNSKFRHPYMQPVDPSLLPAPTNQEIVAMLIGQKDIFPVLESILRLIAAGSSPQTPIDSASLQRPAIVTHPSTRTSYERRTPAQIAQAQQYIRQSTITRPISSEGPPSKKRKLHRVPAGAADWDVPYPFPSGEGPDSYRTTWERERGKQLISQLVSLIKNAARKAATKNYLQNEEVRKAALETQRGVEPGSVTTHQSHGSTARKGLVDPNDIRVHGHYRPATVTYGLAGDAAVTAQTHMQEVLADGAARTVTTTPQPPYQSVPAWPTATSSSGPQPSTPFDQLISSLLAASPDQQTNLNTMAPGLSASTSSSFNVSAADGSANGGGIENGGNVDQNLFDSWMDILQTFPMPSDGFAHNQDQWQPPQPVPQSSISTLDGFGGHNDAFNPQIKATDVANTSGPQVESDRGSLAQGDQHASHTDNLIDPALLAISIPQPIQHSRVSGATAGMPVLTPSPIPSISSFGDPGPTTPSSANWDMSMPEVYTVPVSGDSETFFPGDGGQAVGESSVHVKDLGKGKEAETVVAAQDKGKSRDWGHLPLFGPTSASQPIFNGMQMIPNPYGRATNLPAVVTSTSTLQTASAPSLTSVKKLNKEDILKRAIERRKQLAAELDRAKTQLWETTIEQGVLAHLVKHYYGISDTRDDPLTVNFGISQQNQ